MNELATYLKSTSDIKLIDDSIKQQFKLQRFIYGRDLIKELKNNFSDKIATTILEILLENEVILKSKAGTSLSDYLFSYNLSVAKHFFKYQILVTEILEKTHFNKKITSNEFQILVTYPEDLHFEKDKDTALLYPKIKMLIQESKTSLNIINPFFDDYGTKQIIPDLLTAAKRGVTIRIVIRGFFDNSEGQKNRESVKLLMDAFKQENVLDYLQIKDYFKRDKKTSKQQFAIHSKILISDDYCYLGSANITSNSLYSNFETGVVFTGSEIKKIQNLFNNLWAISKPIFYE